MLAGAVIAGGYRHAPSLKASPTVPVTVDIPANRLNPNGTKRQRTTTANAGTVLWIDTVHSPYDCAQIFREMKDNFHFKEGDFTLLCLDILGAFREDFYSLIHLIEDHIRKLKPALIVIDDIDHFMPNCGINVASTFNHVLRDTLNHTETAFLLIGYNHLGKRASTTGDLGKLLFPGSNSVFSVSTQNGVSHVRTVRALEYACNDEPGFIFSIGEGNIPHEMVKTLPSGNISPTLVEQCALKDIVAAVIEPGESLSPDELVTRVSKRQAQLNRIDRARTLMAQAITYGLIEKQSGSNTYTLTDNRLDENINTSLTLPPHPSGSIRTETPVTAPPSTPCSDPVPMPSCPVSVVQ